jgi:hypothetical protein
MISLRTLAVLLFTVSGGLSACRSLIEARLLWQNPTQQLQLRLFDEHLPLHFQGRVYQVGCQSRTTADLPSHGVWPAGWRFVTNGMATHVSNVRQLLDAGQVQVRGLEHDAIALQSGDLLIVIAAHCQHFSAWHPQQLPAALLAPTQDAPCAAGSATHCANRPLQPHRAVYEDIRYGSDQSIRFRVRSLAVRSGHVHVARDGAAGPWRYTLPGP